MKITNKLDLLRYLQAQTDSIYHEVKASIQDLSFGQICFRLKEYAQGAEKDCPIAELAKLL